MPTYQCQLENCSYTTTSRAQIHYHHIVPKELGGKHSRENRVWLCPTHHTHVYVQEAIYGHHTQINEHSIIILGWRMSTVGRVLIYKKVHF